MSKTANLLRNREIKEIVINTKESVYAFAILTYMKPEQAEHFVNYIAMESDNGLSITYNTIEVHLRNKDIVILKNLTRYMRYHTPEQTHITFPFYLFARKLIQNACHCTEAEANQILQKGSYSW